MIKKIYDKMDKQAITQLPQVTFPGRIVTILTEGEAGRAVDYLLTHRLLGIDSETRPAFKRGQRFKVSLHIRRVFPLPSLPDRIATVSGAVVGEQGGAARGPVAEQ